MKSFVHIVFFCLFFFSLPSVYAQNLAFVESLENELKNAQFDSTKVVVLNKLCRHYVFSDSDKALDYANKAFIIAQKGCTSKDVSRLIDAVKQRVKEQFEIELELEIEIWK